MIDLLNTIDVDVVTAEKNTINVSEVKKKNNWKEHLAQFRKDHPELSYRDAQKQAKFSYKKS